MTCRVTNVLEYLELCLASEFARSVEAALRRLTDVEINDLYLRTHTDWHMGDEPHAWIAVLMPLIEKEWELRRDLQVVPYIGPVIAPDLYRKGGGHYVPF